MEAQTTITIGPLLISVVGGLLLFLLAIIGFGIKGKLAALDETLQLIFTKLDAVMTRERCEENHKSHQNQHDLEKENHRTQHTLEGKNHEEAHERLEKDLNGIGKKVDDHIKDKEAHSK